MSKYGAGALSAFARQGLKELGAALSKPLLDSIQVDELGSIANPQTPGEIAAAKEGDFKSRMARRPAMEQEPSRDGPVME